MMKKYFTDGLIQIAIVLSLLRSDLHEYLHNIANDYSRERYGVHEIILGSGTSAFTQTEHHGDWYSDLSTTVHPKNIDNYISSSVFRDLHRLGNYQLNNVDTSIHAYLVPSSSSSSTSSSSSSSESDSSDNNNNANIQSNSSINVGNDTVQQDDTESVETSLSVVSSGSELTVEDMDLIEILWRQDIDMGVSKDTFNSTIRKELEKDENLELLKEKEEQKLKKEAEESQTSDNTGEGESNVTFIIDVETGELIPAPPGTVVPENAPQSMDVEPHTQSIDQMPISFEEAIEILERESRSGSTSSLSTPPDSSYVNPTQNRSAEVMENVSQQEIDSLVQNISQLSGFSLSRQTSLEARWNDVEGFINDGNGLASMTQNTSMDTNSTLETSDNRLGVLLQNASLNTGGQDTSFNLSQALAVSSNDIMPLNLNETQPLFNSDDALASLFPNASAVTSVNSSENLLSDLLRSVEHNVNLTRPLVPTDVIKIEDGDSAVGSMGSEGDVFDNLQDFGDSHSNLTSPFDGLEGATGGQESASQTVTKYDPQSHRYSFSTIEWNSTEFHSTNHSSGENDTDSSSYEDTTLADPRAVAHNHSYVLKPGQDSKEEVRKQKELDRKINRSRDERRAKAMKLPISIDDIIYTPVEKFTELLSKHRLTEPQLQLVKDIRRRGKNKVAAQNCRKRKMEVIETLEESVSRMREEKGQFVREKAGLHKQRDKIREMYGGLYRDVFRSLRDEHGNPYDPNQYTLQHTADGNVFLIPKTNSTSDDPQIKDTKKRKGRK